MSIMTRVGGLVGILAVVFGLAFVGGRLVGPDVAPVVETHHMGDDAGGHSEHEMAPMAPGGLASSADGYTLALASSRTDPGRRSLSFTITDDDGHPVTSYERLHEKLLHLIVVRRDLTGLQHLHPVLDEAGRWRTPADLTAGSWRVIADFQPTGAEQVTLGTDLQVAGEFRPRALGEDRRTAEVDGFRATLAGDLEPGETTELVARISLDGEPVTDLQPYLGAFGHLVMLRDGDLAYVHVHPQEGEPGPVLAFEAGTPSAGSYRLFLDFKHDGVVRTAAFTLHVGAGHGH